MFLGLCKVDPSPVFYSFCGQVQSRLLVKNNCQGFKKGICKKAHARGELDMHVR